MKSICALAGMAVSGLGCVTSSVETTRLNAAPGPLVPRSVRSVEIYASSPPTRPHVDVALLRASNPSHTTDTARLVQSLAERAGQLGCDALFITGASTRYSRHDVLFGTCIAYLPQSPAEALAAPSPPQLVPNAIVIAPPEERKPRPTAIVDRTVTGSIRR
jgi:hypothetical protein